MKVSLVLRCVSVAAAVLASLVSACVPAAGAAGVVFAMAASSDESQGLPVIPPSIDPAFWGRANAPYSLKLTQTSIDANGTAASSTHSMVMRVYRDSKGRVLTDTLADNGLPKAMAIQDPIENTLTVIYVAPKTVAVLPQHRPQVPLPGNGWAVERLGSRVVDGIPAEGFRFTRTIPADVARDGLADTTVDEEWVTNELGVVLEQTSKNRRGTTTKTVSEFKQGEPDPALFMIPTGYRLIKPDPPAHRP